MFRINRLEEQYHELVAADQREYRELTESVLQIGSGFANYLASDDGSNALSGSKPLVICGMQSENGFINPDPERFARVGRNMQFTLRLDLAESVTEIPPSYFIFKLELMPKDNQIHLFDRENAEEILLHKGFISAYEYLYNAVSNRLRQL
ncbi:hypothetical protein [Pseudomonas syringae]|uniref:hypothetical protein n=1 Tax=Pseudomonas syringae TaxID=317 RepID=UPI001F1179C7|nr:hypothetical protein [Pseudomonas syringae]MCH5486748.1 hypothetical protein [Pseudomonas syringae pv. syringae]MDO1457678.1 hypothetical protein [Pseudomonas syringae pv. syringae]